MGEKLKKRRILITGASGGIGSAIARGFAAEGCYLGLHCNSNLKETSSLLKEVKKLGSNGSILCGDLLEKSFRNSLIDLFIAKAGGIDILVNCAGAAYSYEDFTSLDEEDWDRTFNLNVKAPFYLTGKAFDEMKSQGGGRIINIGSISVKYGGGRKGLHYASSKGALETMTRGFARAGAPYGILVNTVRCGLISTNMRNRIKGYKEKNYIKREKLVLLGRSGTPEEVAAAVIFLASSEASYITGEAITVAGGD